MATRTITSNKHIYPPQRRSIAFPLCFNLSFHVTRCGDPKKVLVLHMTWVCRTCVWWTLLCVALWALFHFRKYRELWAQANDCTDWVVCKSWPSVIKQHSGFWKYFFTCIEWRSYQLNVFLPFLISKKRYSFASHHRKQVIDGSISAVARKEN